MTAEPIPFPVPAGNPFFYPTDDGASITDVADSYARLADDLAGAIEDELGRIAGTDEHDRTAAVLRMVATGLGELNGALDEISARSARTDWSY